MECRRRHYTVRANCGLAIGSAYTTRCDACNVWSAGGSESTAQSAVEIGPLRLLCSCGVHEGATGKVLLPVPKALPVRHGYQVVMTKKDGDLRRWPRLYTNCVTACVEL